MDSKKSKKIIAKITRKPIESKILEVIEILSERLSLDMIVTVIEQTNKKSTVNDTITL